MASETTADVGLIGLAVMGQNLALNMADHGFRVAVYNRFWGMNVDPTSRISMSAKLDRTYPKGVHIRARSYVAFGATCGHTVGTP